MHFLFWHSLISGLLWSEVSDRNSDSIIFVLSRVSIIQSPSPLSLIPLVSNHNAIGVIVFWTHSTLSPCCASLWICSVLSQHVLFSAFIILFRWLDSVELHYVYLKSHQVSQTLWVFSILNPFEEYRPSLRSFSTAVWKAVSHYKGSSVEYKQGQLQSRLPGGFPAEIVINISDLHQHFCF